MGPSCHRPMPSGRQRAPWSRSSPPAKGSRRLAPPPHPSGFPDTPQRCACDRSARPASPAPAPRWRAREAGTPARPGRRVPALPPPALPGSRAGRERAPLPVLPARRRRSAPYRRCRAAGDFFRVPAAPPFLAHGRVLACSGLARPPCRRTRPDVAADAFAECPRCALRKSCSAKTDRRSKAAPHL